ncbi:ZIP family metal transporter [Salinibacillus xinjiangensis]|uniref:ZIP family metal transporter n=1 Tax=Salinibacillus xinjiangensis TaxID=1229268 RepID=A0A6G1X3W4_9BACI|nr:ZIP family metal transporter [Salinibacillus xinjiangensis]MRG85637.1 ZIP family metal transporter [Salinibacillus xinjiangensis]
MLQALLWGGLAGSALFIGALIGLYFDIPKKIIAYVMAFGSGVLIGAAAFEMLYVAAKEEGLVPTTIGFLAGAALFTIINSLLAKKGASQRKRSSKNPEGHSGLAIFVGTIIDSLPEAVVIGISMIDMSVSLVLVIAIFISNLPEGLSSTIGLKQDQYSKMKILTLWIVVFILTALSSLGGYVWLDSASGHWIASINTFAAGGIIAMVSSTMMPEAYSDGGRIVGLITSVGLILSLILTFI